MQEVEITVNTAKLKNRRVSVGEYNGNIVLNFRMLHKNITSSSVCYVEKRVFGNDLFTSLTFKLSKEAAWTLKQLLEEQLTQK